MDEFALFFFSSRRRHTSSYGDWSSDVCSSDLDLDGLLLNPGEAGVQEEPVEVLALKARVGEREPHGVHREADRRVAVDRSEERRVGKECGSRSGSYDDKKQQPRLQLERDCRVR